MNEFSFFEGEIKSNGAEVKAAGKGLFGIIAGSYACYWMTVDKQRELGEKLGVKPEIVTYFSGLTGILDSVVKIGGFFGLEKLGELAEAHDHITVAGFSDIGSLAALFFGIWGLVESPYRMHLANKTKEGVPGFPVRVYEKLKVSAKEIYNELLPGSL